MKMISWLFLLILTFCIALVLVLTFIQPEFKQEVSMRLLAFSTQKVPIYLYVLGAFTIGLGFGLITAIIGYFKAKMVEMKKNKRIRELETALAEAGKDQNPAPSTASPSDHQPPGTAGN
jgi:uncharacterized membrane protein YciS (DUF1049 family)